MPTRGLKAQAHEGHTAPRDPWHSLHHMLSLCYPPWILTTPGVKGGGSCTPHDSKNVLSAWHRAASQPVSTKELRLCYCGSTELAGNPSVANPKSA